MEKRPELNQALDGAIFRNYYYLKEELVKFCRDSGLPVSGGKIELTERIAAYLDTGEIKAAKPAAGKRTQTSVKRKVQTGEITEDMVIEPDFVCSEKHRAFFKEKLGGSFSFQVTFQNWLKSNPGKTYRQAIEAYCQIQEEKKKGRTVIDRQFEYNTYIRDFFADNQGKSLEDAIRCWKQKKSLPGHNRYEQCDLAALT